MPSPQEFRMLSALRAADTPEEDSGVSGQAVGAAAGTILGALAGSFIPGAGTAVGGSLGATLGGSLGGLIGGAVDESQGDDADVNVALNDSQRLAAALAKFGDMKGS